MLQMQVVLDIEKINQDKVYNAEKIQQAIDSVLLSEYKLVKTAGDIYLGSGSEDDYASFWNAILTLKDEEWFLNNVKTWLWFNSDDSDDPEDFAIEDLREHYLSKHRRSA